MTSCEIILKILLDAGDSGVHSFDLGRQAQTWRAAARINDLKHKGYTITSIPEKRNGTVGCRYFIHLPKPVESIQLTLI
jgi:hypothetical protein